MIKLTVSYETEKEKTKILTALCGGVKIKHIGKPKKTGRYNRMYIVIE